MCQLRGVQYRHVSAILDGLEFQGSIKLIIGSSSSIKCSRETSRCVDKRQEVIEPSWSRQGASRKRRGTVEERRGVSRNRRGTVEERRGASRSVEDVLFP
eukprot:gene9594-biopygen8597